MMNKFTLQVASLLLMALGLFQTANAQSTFWTEDFSGGIPSGWTNEDASGNNALWTWCANPENGQTGGCPAIWDDGLNLQSPFASATSTNGFMTMDSDLVGPLAANHISELTTASIDCSSQSEVWVKFESLIGVFELDADPYAVVRVSTDGGATWTSYPAFPGLVTGAPDPGNARWSLNPHYTIVDISAVAGGQSDVLIQWQWEGNWEYMWNLDDVALYDADPTTLFLPGNDLRLINNFYATAPNAQWPLSMVEPFGFVADIDNNGFLDQTNVNLNITITDLINGDVEFTADNSYGTVLAGEAVIDQVFPGLPYLPSEIGAYEGVYTLTADSVDVEPADNTVSFQFAITEDLFAKETEAIAVTNLPGSNWDVGDPWSWAYGNYFYVTNADDRIIENVEFGIDGTDQAGEVVIIKVYTWNDENENAIVEPGERTPLGIAPYVLTGTEDPATLISIAVKDPLGNDIVLTDETAYLVMMEYVTDQTDATLNFPYSDETNFGGMVFWTTENGAPRYASILATDGDLETADFGTLGFGYDIVARVRMTIGESVNTVEQLDLANTTSVFPNPANDQITLEMNFTEPMDEVLVQVFDMTGKLILAQEIDQVQKQQVDYDLSNFHPGTYLFHIQTKAGVRTERFTVVK